MFFPPPQMPYSPAVPAESPPPLGSEVGEALRLILRQVARLSLRTHRAIEEERARAYALAPTVQALTKVRMRVAVCFCVRVYLCVLLCDSVCIVVRVAVDREFHVLQFAGRCLVLLFKCVLCCICVCVRASPVDLRA